MQKKIIALAIAAAFAAPVAMADTANMSFFGTLDGGIRHQTNDAPANGTTDSMALGQYNSNRWGFKVAEDLGEGLKANVWLEGSLLIYGTTTGSAVLPNPATGNNPNGLLFDRQATIGLEGGFGKADMGYNYTVAFTSNVKYDPLGYKFLGLAYAKPTTGTERSNNISYENKFGDVSLRAQYVMNNAQAGSQPSSGAGRAVGVDYASGPISVGLSYTATEDSTAAGDDAATRVTGGAGFDFGDGKVSVGYDKNSNKTAANDNFSTNMWLGAKYNVSSKIGATLAYYKNTANDGGTTSVDSNKSRIIGAVTYSLSKRTTAYFEMDTQTSNAGGTAIDVKTTGSGIGLATTF